MVRPSNSHTYFLDECLDGNHLVGVLSAAGILFERHRIHFPRNALAPGEKSHPDPRWISFATEKGWVILTKDDRTRRPTQIQAYEAAKAAAFILAGGDLRAEEQSQAILTAVPKIERWLHKFERPLIAAIQRSGELAERCKLVRCAGVQR